MRALHPARATCEADPLNVANLVKSIFIKWIYPIVKTVLNSDECSVEIKAFENRQLVGRPAVHIQVCPYFRTNFTLGFALC